MGSVPDDTHIHSDVYEPLTHPRVRSHAAASGREQAKALRVAVVGGGIGGLCTAIGLLKHPHLDVQVYEAAHKFSEIGAGIGVGPNAENALELLGPNIYAAYLRQATKCPFRICNGQATGKLAGETLSPADSTYSQSTVHRAKFLDALVELVPPERAHFGKRLVSVEDMGKADEWNGLVLTFKDGTTVIADAVIGADGIHSHARDHVLEDEPDKEKYRPRYSGATAYRNLIPMERVIQTIGKNISQFNSLFILDGAMVLSYPVDHNARLNVVAYTWKHTDWPGKEWVVPVEREEVLASYHGQDKRVTELLNVSCGYFFNYTGFLWERY
jgi:salicylate hydroxylase